MRLCPASAAADDRLGYDRVTFDNPFDVVTNGVPSPKIRPSILEDVPLNVEWPEVYAGNGGGGDVRQERRFLDRIRIVVDRTGTYRGNRTPVVVVVLGIPAEYGDVGDA